MADFLKSLLLLSLCGSFIGLLLMLLRRCLGRKLSYTFCYYAWLIVLLRLVLPVPGLIPTQAPEREIREEALVPAYTQQVRDNAPALPYTQPDNQSELPSPVQAPPTPAPAVISSKPGFSANALMGILKAESFWLRVWMLGALFCIGRSLAAYLRFSWLMRHTVHQPTPGELELYNSIAQGKKPELFRSPYVSSPMLLGLIKPVLLLPDRDYAPKTLPLVLRHELSHYRRRDIAYKWAVAIVFALHWFNPLMPLFRREIDHCCELCCDEQMLKTMDRQQMRSYGEALISLAASPLPKRVIAGAFTTEKRDLKERLSHIMKFKNRNRAAAFITALALILLCGCGAAMGPAPEAESSPVEKSDAQLPPTPQPVTEEVMPLEQPALEIPEGGISVSTVDELIAAIAPDTLIVLEPGTYLLSDAESYGSATGNPFCFWNSASEGYELRIENVDGLSIFSQSPDSTRILSDDPYVNVLSFAYCDSLSLTGFTAGHVEGKGTCSGGVIDLGGCNDATIQVCKLFGCGIIGVNANACTGVNVVATEIYDCSYHAVNAASSRKIYVEGCSIYDCGSDYDADSLFNLNNCVGAALLNNRIYKNNCTGLLDSIQCRDVSMLGCTVEGNNFADAPFCAEGSSPVVDSCAFSSNTFRSWYSESSVPVLSSAGTELTGNDFEAMAHAPASFVGFAAEEESSAKEVRVSTVDEFLAAIAPNTTIYMEAGTYDLAAATGYGKTDGDYYYWEECFDGHGLIINAVEGLSIIGAGADSTEISAIPRYANVLSFYNCSGLSLSGFTAGHTQEPGECTGGVIDLWCCIGVKIDSCGLYGCGVTGISAIESSDISVDSTEIYDCSYTPVHLSAVRNAVFENCSIHDCGNNNQFFIAPDCSDIKT